MTESETIFTSRIRKRTPLIYGLLLAVWVMVIVWQVWEHNRVKESARTALINRSQDIATTLSLVIRSQRRFGGIVSQERLEPALKELAKSGELVSVALLNASGEVVASAGKPIDLTTVRQGVRWDEKSVTLVNPVDLGANITSGGEMNPPTIVLPPRDSTNAFRNVGRRSQRQEVMPNREGSSNVVTGAVTNRNDGDHGPAGGDEPRIPPPPPNEGDRNPRGRGDRPPFGRPFWMDEKEYQSLIEKRGLHGLAMAMSTGSIQAASVQDLWLRFVIGLFAGGSVLGLGLAWQNLVKSSELQMHLLRASQMNSYLREMNIAAAGLAHETRNPLNIVRGMAQMISKEPAASEEIKSRSRAITDEVDRVTAQLNEFIDYSRPREVRRAPVALGAVIGDVVRALLSDIEDKAVQLKMEGENFVVDADEQLLRQVLFNLLINGIQAVEARGEIQVVAEKSSSTEAQLEVRDNGPGVPPEHRTDIFKPYFTTHPSGTGLGLAVVQQIVLAHGWDISYIPNEPRGAIFRISHLKLSSRTE
ncbi:MAG: ATP-binding protein [Verrucomicrobiia bacterium]